MIAQFILWFILVFCLLALIWMGLRILANSAFYASILTGLGLCLFVILAYYAYQWNAVGADEDFEYQRGLKRIAAREKLDSEDEKRLHNFAWADPEKGLVRIPIQDAMKLQVAALATGKVTPANPIQAPVPATPTPSPDETADAKAKTDAKAADAKTTPDAQAKPDAKNSKSTPDKNKKPSV